jgi:beta-glucanase (GH16 family)
MKPLSLPAFVCLLVLFPLPALAQCPSAPPTGSIQWTPQWCDEFNGAPGTPIDNTKWEFERGDLQVNNELEWYCGPAGDPANQTPCDQNPGGASNAYIDGNGHLVIQALRITNDTAPSSKAWTSARMTTGSGLGSFQYGRIEARMQLPVGPGIWPAFWSLGTNIGTVGWPASGEMDFMENVPASGGLGPNKIRSTIHGPGYSGANGLGHDFDFTGGASVTGFHVYGAIWSPDMVQFYVDDPANIFFVLTPSDLPAGTQWAYNHPFFLLLNLAVGGTQSWPGPPDQTTPSPAVMLVDWVRVYSAGTIAGPNITPAGAITVNPGSSGSTSLTLTSTSGTGNVYLECSGAPAKSTCTLNPHVVDFSATGNATSMLQITTTAPAPKVTSAAEIWGGTLGLTGVLLFPFGRSARRAWLRRLCSLLGVLTLFLVTAALPSCGGGSGGNNGGGGGTPGTPSGSYTLTVTAHTISGDTSTGTVSLTVN